MPEAVRLVIWDLDETFWRGTLTEGGITEYRQDNHDFVINLAQRGIISSICSKNDSDVVKLILVERDIWQYFVFPSINWTPKAQRVAKIIDDFQLRAETVMFIDDNPGNLAEVKNLVSGIQVHDERDLGSLFSSHLFQGKDDKLLSRLNQYKTLEKRQLDRSETLGDNVAFLRNSRITVSIEHDVTSHLDRAIELVNRTNQLNFTKRRLPEQLEDARRQLLSEISGFDRQAGLVKVVDNYGDYGFIGFYLLRGAFPDSELIHFCFSCRTLGMYVERWVYEQLRRPTLSVVGDVLTDLDEDRSIDWVRQTLTGDERAETDLQRRPEIRLVGGCEVNSIAHYLTSMSDRLTIEAAFSSGQFLVRVNSTAMLLSASSRDNHRFRDETERLGLPYNKMISHVFEPTKPGSLIIFGAHLDSGYIGYRHKVDGWEIKIEPSAFWDNLIDVSEHVIKRYVEDQRIVGQAACEFEKTLTHLRKNYSSHTGPSDEQFIMEMEDLFSKLPINSRLIMIAPGEVVRNGGMLEALPWLPPHVTRLEKVCENVPYVRIVYVNDCVQSNEEIQDGWNHYDRMVYYRLSQKILRLADEMPAKA